MKLPMEKKAVTERKKKMLKSQSKQTSKTGTGTVGRRRRGEETSSKQRCKTGRETTEKRKNTFPRFASLGEKSPSVHLEIGSAIHGFWRRTSSEHFEACVDVPSWYENEIVKLLNLFFQLSQLIDNGFVREFRVFCPERIQVGGGYIDLLRFFGEGGKNVLEFVEIKTTDKRRYHYIEKLDSGDDKNEDDEARKNVKYVASSLSESELRSAHLQVKRYKSLFANLMRYFCRFFKKTISTGQSQSHVNEPIRSNRVFASLPKLYRSNVRYKLCGGHVSTYRVFDLNFLRQKISHLFSHLRDCEMRTKICVVLQIDFMSALLTRLPSVPCVEYELVSENEEEEEAGENEEEEVGEKEED